ncbi:MAG: twin-arginine translocase TatA/TatE family subunit [Spirochaetales bacterium]|nr:twin-arginine translocase TatA/TatE family subunit [Spirochaetales bacterium]
MVHGTEIMVIAIVVLVLFGATAIPKFMKSLGQARAELEKGYKEGIKDAPEEHAKADGKKDEAVT